MLAWVMNMGFAASPSGHPGSVARHSFIVQGIGTLIRAVPLATLGLLFVGR